MRIPFYDFGGDGPVIHFAHPNGYLPACFQRMFDPFLSQYRVVGVCHRPLWPGTQPEDLQSWRTIADDLISFFEQERLQNVIGIGHSLGAVATMYVALQRPQLFRSLVLIEPIFLPKDALAAVAADPDSIMQIPIIKNTIRRRNRWPSREAAFEHFRGKEAFERWPDAALHDYVNHALTEDENGDIVLSFSRQWEVRIYSRPPLDVWEAIPAIEHPTLAIRGSESDALFPDAWQYWQRLQPGARFLEIEDAGHMLVMERSETVAEAILEFLRE